MSPVVLKAARRDNSNYKLAMCIAGIVGSLLIYGVLQERIMTLPFGAGSGEEVFRSSFFLVVCNRLVACAIAAGLLLAQGEYSELRPIAPLGSYARVALSNVTSTTCQYEALRHVSFSVATLGKCAKMFPVMLWGMVILRRRYSWRDVGLALAITGGCFVFFTTGSTASRVAAGPRSNVSGVLLMALYLVSDGYTSTVQQSMFKGHAMSTYNQVVFTSLWSIVFSCLGFAASGQALSTLGFLARHPEALLHIFVLSLAASCGSICITYTVKAFGALTFATIMTTRQFLSILLSAVVFGAPLSPGQWCGTLIVVTALYYQGFAARDRDRAALRASANGGAGAKGLAASGGGGGGGGHGRESVCGFGAASPNGAGDLESAGSPRVRRAASGPAPP